MRRGVELDAEFHVLFAHCRGNHKIRCVMVQVRERMNRVITTEFQLHPARIDSSDDEHRAVAEVVLIGNGADIARLVDLDLRGRQTTAAVTASRAVRRNLKRGSRPSARS